MSKKKKTGKEPPILESAPIKFWNPEEEKLEVEVRTTKGESKADAFFAQIKEVTGVKDSELAMNIITTGATTIDPLIQKDEGGNIVVQTLHNIGPIDALESRLVVQATSLYLHGMKCLRRSETASKVRFNEYYANTAIKLLRLHNETIAALGKYRRGGEQKIVVQHNVVADKAVVNFGEGGGNIKNGGKNPCSGNYAGLKPERTAIDHVDSPRWPMGDVGSMEESVRAQRQTRESDG